MSETKSVDVNNSDKMFVTGVMYGLMHAIEMIQSDRVTLCKPHNKLAELINANLQGCWMKIFETFSLIKKHERVPDLQKMLKELTSDKRYINGRQAEAKCLDAMWETISNENK